MEDWLSGGVLAETHMTLKLPGADGVMPTFEDACLRAMCFCGRKMCKVGDRWSVMGEPTHADMKPSKDVNRRALWTPTVSQAQITAEIFVVFGISKMHEVPTKDYGIVHYDDTFNFNSPWTQRALLSFCVATAPRLRIASRRCWIHDFQRWTAGRGLEFPLRSGDFYDQFELFLASMSSRSEEALPTSDLSTSTKGYNYFWFSTNRTVKACFFSFAVDAPLASFPDEVEAYKKLWGRYMWARKAEAFPGYGYPWLASSLFADWEDTVAVKDGAKVAVTAAFVVVTLFTFSVTWSIGLTLAVACSLAVCLAFMIVIAIGAGKRDFGVTEELALVVFLSLLMPPMIRAAYQYSIAQEGPGQSPLTEDQIQDSPKRGRGMSRTSTQSDAAFGSALGGHGHPSHHHTSNVGLASLLGFMSQDIPEQMFLVDNRILGAKTVGLGYRLSPKLKDLDANAKGHKNVAPWGSMVKGAPCGPDWVRVGQRFLPRHLDSTEVLVLEDDDRSSSGDGDHDGLRQLVSDTYWGPKMQLWDGCTRAERTRRISSVLRRSLQTLMGTSIAGVCVGMGMMPLRMQALGQLGLSSLCAALTLPPIVLGLLPIMISLGFGPTRVRRRVLWEFAGWLHAGRPLGFNPTISLDTRDCAGQVTPDYEHDWRAPGEVAAEELGFPFTLCLRTLGQHLKCSRRTGPTRKFEDEEEDVPHIYPPASPGSPQPLSPHHAIIASL